MRGQLLVYGSSLASRGAFLEPAYHSVDFFFTPQVTFFVFLCVWWVGMVLCSFSLSLQ